MNLKNICLGALALSMVSGFAFAGGILDSPDLMSPFFTDSGMKTMKPMEEMKAAFMAMPKDKQEAMMKECMDTASAKSHADFCVAINTLGGANK